MTKISSPVVALLAVTLIAGCGRLPTRMDIEEQTVGPIASPDFENLIHESASQTIGEVRVFGMANWIGFSVEGVKFSLVDPFYQGIVALTDTDILLLSWSEDQNQYEILKKVAYSNIRYRPTKDRQSLQLKLLDPNFTLGGKTYQSWERTYLEFIKPSGVFVDRENLRRAHALIKEKVEHFELEVPVTSYDEEY